MSKRNIIIATIKSWNIENAIKLRNKLKDEYGVYLITHKKKLILENINKYHPDYIFFPHWSWIIPSEIFNSIECVVFHETDLPYGRGGSPLQNLIARKVYNTQISAIKVDKGIDTGDIYLKRRLSLKTGSAEEIFKLTSKIIFEEMIPYILENNPKPKKQKGIIVNFTRRTPKESNILQAKLKTLGDVYDFIRMLDAENYPKAFFKLNKIKIELSSCSRNKNIVKGNFEAVYEK